MSAEGPVRKPSSEPPDVDSLMSRLDGQAESEPDRTSDPGGERRPSAAELLGGRGRRTKRTIRVPDDAVPAGTPPPAPVRRSVPPPAATSISGPESSGPVTTAATPNAKAASIPAPAPVPAHAEAAARELLQKESLFPEVVRITPQRIISVGAPFSQPPAPLPSSPSSSSPLPPAPQPAVPHASAPLPAPPQQPDPAAPQPIASPAIAPFSAGEALPPETPEASGVQPLPDRPVADAPVLPNLDAQVREALALLDREDFETTIEISVTDEEPTNPALPKVQLPGDEAPSSEDLGDDELEEVDDRSPATKPNVPPPRRGPPSGRPNPPTDASAPVPVVIPPVPVPVMPPAQLGAAVPTTLPSAAETSAPPSSVP